jgi:predicted Zn-dependent protease
VDCREGRIPDDLPEQAVVEATEQEIRAAVARGWRFVFSPGSSAYLNRLAERIARHVEGAPGRPRVVLIDEPSLTTLALPSGLVLISVGSLEALEDEAELVFVLGHELVHAAGGEAAHRLVRLGLVSVTRDADAADSRAWLDAVQDTISLGYGRAREHDADARSLQAFLALGYDPNSILRYFRRLDARVGAGDPTVRELALAHPSPADRMRQVTRTLHSLTGSLPANVNREVFRRAVLGADLDPCTLDEADAADREGERPAAGGSRWLWTGIGIALLAALILLVGILLAG